MRPLWVSHRGFKANAVENTLEAFRAAVAVGFRALETDLRLSADGHIVLHHDPDLRRLAQRPDPVETLTRAQLEKVRLHAPAGDTRLLFLDEFVSEFAGCSWTFDIKSETATGVARALDSFVRAKGLYDWVVANVKFVSWRAEHERLLGELFPKVAHYAREPECWRAGVALIARVPGLAGIRAGRTYALPPWLGRLDMFREPYLRAFHARGATVMAFLPETDEDVRRAMRCGVDEILTNGLIVGEEA